MTGTAIALPTKDTYQLVFSTMITAHSIDKTIKQDDLEYLIPIADKGYVGWVCKIDKVIEVSPSAIEFQKDILSEDEYKRLLAYHEGRIASGKGYKKKVPYKYYFLSKYAEIEYVRDKEGALSHNIKYVQNFQYQDLNDVFVR